MKASSLLYCALRSPDPVRIGKFYASLFDCGFFVHPVLAGLGVAIVKIASPESVSAGCWSSGPWICFGMALRLPFAGFRKAFPRCRTVWLFASIGPTSKFSRS